MLPLHLLLSSGEKTADNLEIRIYEGATGEFTLYEDESDNYNYEKGICSTIKLIWNDVNKTLTISNREGTFPSLLYLRTFSLVIVSSNKAIGVVKVVSFESVVSYAGKKVEVKF